MTQLLPCPSCSRHVRVSETRCPFCATALEAPSASRLGAALAVGVTMALAGCAAHTEQPDPNQIKPVPTSTPATTQGAVVAPTTQPEQPRFDAPAYGLAPPPNERPKNKYGAPPPPKKP